MEHEIVESLFAIVKNGQVPAMQLVLGSGDVALDRAAWASITNSQPFPPLPAARFIANTSRFVSTITTIPQRLLTSPSCRPRLK